MKLRSDEHRHTAIHTLLGILLFSGIALDSQPVYAQYRTWSVAAAVGFNRLNLSAVDRKNSSDVAGWLNLYGITVPNFESVKTSPFYSGSVQYRSDREFAISFSGIYWNKSISSAYDGPDAVLHLDRSVGSADIMFGVAYFPGAQARDFEWYIQGNVDLTMARATIRSVGSSAQKPGGTLILVPFIDTDAKYKKSSMSAGLGVGADIRLSGPFSLTANAGYRFAQLGTMEGDVTQFGVHTTQASTTEFDFSGLQISAGIRFDL
jgi:hypothetical protein